MKQIELVRMSGFRQRVFVFTFRLGLYNPDDNL
jgi:hypothetical protein